MIQQTRNLKSNFLHKTIPYTLFHITPVTLHTIQPILGCQSQHFILHCRQVKQSTQYVAACWKISVVSHQSDMRLAKIYANCKITGVKIDTDDDKFTHMQNRPPLMVKNTKVCAWGEVPVIIIPVKFNVDRFRGFWFLRVDTLYIYVCIPSNWGVPLTRRVALTTVQNCDVCDHLSIGWSQHVSAISSLIVTDWPLHYLIHNFKRPPLKFQWRNVYSP